VNTPIEPLLIDAAGVARMLGVSRRHVHALESSGRIPSPVRLSRSVRWRVAEIREFVAAGCPSRDKFIQQQEGKR